MGEKLNVIIKDSAYKLTQFTQKSIDELEDKVFLKKDKPYIKCMVRQKDIKLTPEEKYAIRWHMGYTEPKELYNAIGASYKKYPIALLTHEADLEATYLFNV